MTLTVEKAKSEDLDRCAELERQSYPEDEAASLEKFEWRFSLFPELFLVARLDDKIIGYICSTRCDAFTEDTMEHEYNLEGKVVAVHSVVISSEVRRRGFGLKLLNEYIAHVRKEINDFNRFELICKVKYSGLYIKAGFKPQQMSAIHHGGDDWLLCILEAKGRDFYVIDAFTNEVGKGNPAAVVICHGFETVEWMQKIAFEFNLSETAFLIETTEDKDIFQVLFFTPEKQITFCGHATVASSKVILDLYPSMKSVTFILTDSTKILTERYNLNQICLKFPIQQTTELEYTPFEDTLTEVFGIQREEVKYIGGYGFRILIEVESACFERLFNVELDFVKLKEASDVYKCWMLTTKNLEYPEQAHFYSRVFVPDMGINEDPVTGSAHCSLFPYYKEKYEIDDNEITAIQTSKRSGKLIAKFNSDADTFDLIASAVLVSNGIIRM